MPASPFFAAALSASFLLTAAGSVSAQTPAPPAVAPPVSAAAPKVDAKADTLSVGPGLFTFPQIAALLSTKEQPITCDFSLKDRAAFVFLMNRSRKEAQELLGAGLQVEFLPPNAPAGLTVITGDAKEKPTAQAAPLLMVRQKAVSERETAWLVRIARVMQTEIQRKINETTSYDGKPFRDAAKTEQIFGEMMKLDKEVGSPPYKSPPPTEAIAQKRDRLATLKAAILAEDKVPLQSQRVGAAWARLHPPALIPLIQGKNNLTLQPVPTQWTENGFIKTTFVPQEFLNGTVLPNASLPPLPTEKYGLVTGHQLSIRPNLITIRAWGELTLLDAPPAPQNGSPSPYISPINYFDINFARPRFYTASDSEADEVNRETNKEVPALFVLLGDEAIRWWEKEQKDTQPWLSAVKEVSPPPPAAPAERKPPRFVYDRLHKTGEVSKIALSDALEGWTAQTHTEAIMELHPRTELWETDETFFEADDTANPANPATPLPLSAWIHNPRNSDQWTVRQQNKVLLITGRMEFLERPQTMPLPELLQLHSEQTKWRVLHGLPLADRDAQSTYAYEPMAAYARAVFNRRDGRTWGAATLADYHGFNLGALDERACALFLWSKISQKEQARLIANALKSSWHTASLPMSYFGNNTLAAIVELKRDRGRDYSGVLSPMFLSALRAAPFEIRVIDPHDPEASRNNPLLVAGYYQVEMGVSSINWHTYPFPDIGASVYLPIPPDANPANP